MIVPFITVVGFAIAGVSVASIALDSRNAHALVRPGLCGLMMTDTYAGPDGNLMLTGYYLGSNTTICAKIYAQDCYAGEGWSSSP